MVTAQHPRALEVKHQTLTAAEQQSCATCCSLVLVAPLLPASLLVELRCHRALLPEVPLRVPTLVLILQIHAAELVEVPTLAQAGCCRLQALQQQVRPLLV